MIILQALMMYLCVPLQALMMYLCVPLQALMMYPCVPLQALMMYPCVPLQALMMYLKSVFKMKDKRVFDVTKIDIARFARYSTV